MRDMLPEELAEQITTLRKDLFGKRFANATGELEDTAGVSRARRCHRLSVPPRIES